MRIGLDLDGVIYPWHYSIYKYFTEFKGYDKDIVEFWSKDKHLVTKYYVDLPFLYLNVSPTKDVIETLPKLAELGELFYITARNPELKRITEKFFRIYDLPFKENLIFDGEKATQVRLRRIDYFLDDFVEHVDSLRGITDAYLMKCVHNCDKRDGYKVVGTLREFYDIIKG